MARRYRFLSKDFVFNAWNKLRVAFLAAKDGNEVEEIIRGVLTSDERMKIGRRIEIAQMLQMQFTYRQIAEELKVGLSTIKLVESKMSQYPQCYKLINFREKKVEKEYQQKAYRKVGGPMKVFKVKKYTGFKRKDIKR